MRLDHLLSKENRLPKEFGTTKSSRSNVVQFSVPAQDIEKQSEDKETLGAKPNMGV